ncbi:MAG: Rieske (2Fe-2S) protein [Armatimonadetes bacterium]|nr:Rieske (2Fe-2S) protein [Armatimonadota bacterium]
MPDISKWRRDLPLEWAVDDYITRRDFTKFLILISGATFLSNGYLVVESMLRRARKFPLVRVAGRDELAVGDVKLFRYPTDNAPAIMIRLSDTSWVAYSQRCTHLTCPVLFVKEHMRLECPCHDGAFDVTDGRVLQGPPPRPLPKIALRVTDEGIFAEGMIAS